MIAPDSSCSGQQPDSDFDMTRADHLIISAGVTSSKLVAQVIQPVVHRSVSLTEMTRISVGPADINPHRGPRRLLLNVRQSDSTE